MPERTEKTQPLGSTDRIKEAVCIDTKRIYDSARDRDCLEDIRVYLTCCGQEVIDHASYVKPRSAEVVWVYIDVEALPFNRGYYTVDIRYFFKVTVEAYFGLGRNSQEVTGLCVFDKKAIMCGGEGNAKIFTSKYRPNDEDIQLGCKTNLPEATVELVDPVLLDAKIVDPCDKCCCGCGCNLDVDRIPSPIAGVFEGVFTDEGDRRLYVSLGLFTIIRLARNVQLLIPSYDFCIPERASEFNEGEGPCEMFRKFKFPIDEFFPPQCPERGNSNCGN